MGYNNPTKVVLKEAQILYSQRSLACIISVGAGLAKTVDIPQDLPWWKRMIYSIIPVDAIRAVQAIATDCETVADEVYHLLQTRFSDKIDDYYMRFNVNRGVQSISLDNWEKLGDINALTEDYFVGSEVTQKASRAVRGMEVRKKAQRSNAPDFGRLSFLIMTHRLPLTPLTVPVSSTAILMGAYSNKRNSVLIHSTELRTYLQMMPT